jgi:hypothetical protein
MSEDRRKELLAEVGEIVKANNILNMPSALKRLRELCKTLTEEELQWTLDGVTPFDGHYHQIIIQEIGERRHKALTKDAWTMIPTFYFVIIGTIASIIAAIAGVVSCHDDSQAKSDSYQLQLDSSPRSLSQLSPIPQEIPPAPQQSAPLPAPALTNSVAEPVAPKK